MSFVKHLTQLKHSVQDVGKPIHKSPDLAKVQTIVDQIKNFDFFNLDEDETESTTQVPEKPLPSLDFDIGKRSSRNVFDDLSGKIGKVISGSKRSQGLKRLTSDGKQKRKSGRLFPNVNVDSYDTPNEYFVTQNRGEVEQEKPVEEIAIAEPSEDQKLLSDLNNFQSLLSVDQQMDISQFLDHIRDKPKPFKFDTSSYLQTEMEKLNHPSAEQEADQQQQDDDLLGTKKFFDFEASSPVKRSLYSGQIEDYQKIAKIKSKLLAEYRQHHPIIDYADISRQLEANNNRKVVETDGFLDHYYRLNDGSSNLDEVMKPFHSDHHVMSPFELNLSFQLENEFKELDSDDQPKSNSLSADIPQT